MPRHSWSVGLTLLLCLTLLAAPAVPAAAAPASAPTAIIVVDTTVDALAIDGQCSLREAVWAANHDAAFGPQPGECADGSTFDFIVLPRQTYTLTISPAGSNDLVTGDLNLFGTITILAANCSGANCEPAVIRGGAGWNDRILNVQAGTAVTLSDVWIQNGHVTGSGGAILHAGARLTLEDSLVSDSTSSAHGGGIYATGPLTLTNTTVMSNTASQNGGGIHVDNDAPLYMLNGTVAYNEAVSGGGLQHDLGAGPGTIISSTFSYNQGTRGGGVTVGDVLTITDSAVLSNTATTNGGGLYNTGSESLLTFSGGEVGGNYAQGLGGGLYNDGWLTMTDSLVHHNETAAGSGGGLFHLGAHQTLISGTVILENRANQAINQNGGGIATGASGLLTVLNSQITGNLAGGNGGGIQATGPLVVDHSTLNLNLARYGGGLHGSGPLTLTASAVISNGAYLDGGGLRLSAIVSDFSWLSNSTISGNSANREGGGLMNWGNTRLANVTITNNHTFGALPGGGGVFVRGGSLFLANSLLAGNGHANTAADDCGGTLPLTSEGYNLIETTTGCTLTGTVTGNQLGVDPLLSPLADNGGSTLTHALLSGSPALNAGNPAAPNGSPGRCHPLDQRDVARPQGTACDIGAFEAVPLSLFLPLIQR